MARTEKHAASFRTASTYPFPAVILHVRATVTYCIEQPIVSLLLAGLLPAEEVTQRRPPTIKLYIQSHGGTDPVLFENQVRLAQSTSAGPSTFLIVHLLYRHRAIKTYSYLALFCNPCSKGALIVPLYCSSTGTGSLLPLSRMACSVWHRKIAPLPG